MKKFYNLGISVHKIHVYLKIAVASQSNMIKHLTMEGSVPYRKGRLMVITTKLPFCYIHSCKTHQ